MNQLINCPYRLNLLVGLVVHAVLVDRSASKKAKQNWSCVGAKQLCSEVEYSGVEWSRMGRRH